MQKLADLSLFENLQNTASQNSVFNKDFSVSRPLLPGEAENIRKRLISHKSAQKLLKMLLAAMGAGGVVGGVYGGIHGGIPGIVDGGLLGAGSALVPAGALLPKVIGMLLPGYRKEALKKRLKTHEQYPQKYNVKEPYTDKYI